jgi:hypothetical protein
MSPPPRPPDPGPGCKAPTRHLMEWQIKGVYWDPGSSGKPAQTHRRPVAGGGPAAGGKSANRLGIGLPGRTSILLVLEGVPGLFREKPGDTTGPRLLRRQATEPLQRRSYNAGRGPRVGMRPPAHMHGTPVRELLILGLKLLPIYPGGLPPTRPPGWGAAALSSPPQGGAAAPKVGGIPPGSGSPQSWRDPPWGLSKTDPARAELDCSTRKRIPPAISEPVRKTDIHHYRLPGARQEW